MSKDDEQIGILCYEIWCSIGDTEVSRKNSNNFKYPMKNYCNKSYLKLLEVIFPHLLSSKQNEEDSWNLSKAASCLLSILSQCCDYKLIESVIQFLGANISNTNFIYQEAAMLAFGAILETSHREEMTNLVTNSIDTLLNFLTSNCETSLKETVAWVIEKIAELYANNFYKYGELFDKLYQAILKLLTASKKKVVCHLCNAIHYFSRGLKPEDGQVSNMLSKHMKDSLAILIQLALFDNSYDSENNVAMSSFYALGSLIENAAPDTKFIINSFFYENLIQIFKSTILSSNTGFLANNDPKRNDYQAYIASCMEPCLINGYIQLDNNTSKEILGYLIQTFIERKHVYEEGLMACSALALSMGQAFNAFLPEFGSYLIYSLNAIKETSLCKTAIHCTSDIIRAIGSTFSNYIPQILPLIIGILSVTILLIDLGY